MCSFLWCFANRFHPSINQSINQQQQQQGKKNSRAWCLSVCLGFAIDSPLRKVRPRVCLLASQPASQLKWVINIWLNCKLFDLWRRWLVFVVYRNVVIRRRIARTLYVSTTTVSRRMKRVRRFFSKFTYTQDVSKFLSFGF